MGLRESYEEVYTKRQRKETRRGYRQNDVIRSVILYNHQGSQIKYVPYEQSHPCRRCQIRKQPHTMWNFPSIIYFQFLLSLYSSIHPPTWTTASSLFRVLGPSLYVSSPCTRYRPVARPPNIKNANAVKTQIFTALMGFEPTIQAFEQCDSTRLETVPIFLFPHLQHNLKFVSGIKWFRS